MESEQPLVVLHFAWLTTAAEHKLRWLCLVLLSNVQALHFWGHFLYELVAAVQIPLFCSRLLVSGEGDQSAFTQHTKKRTKKVPYLEPSV